MTPGWFIWTDDNRTNYDKLISQSEKLEENIFTDIHPSFLHISRGAIMLDGRSNKGGCHGHTSTIEGDVSTF